MNQTDHDYHLKLRLPSIILFFHLTQGISGLFYIERIGANGLFVLTWIVLIVYSRYIISTDRFIEFNFSGVILIFSGIMLSGLIKGNAISDLRQYLNYISVFVLIVMVFQNCPRYLLKVISLALAFHICVAAMEFINGTTFFYSTWKNPNSVSVNNFIRVASTIGDPNYLALALFILSASIIYISRVIGVREKTYGLFSYFGFLFIPLTFSRAGIIALISLLFILLVKKNRRRIGNLYFFAMLVASLPTLLTVFQTPFIEAIFVRFTGFGTSDASSQSRLITQSFGFETIKQNPIFGVGPGNFELISQNLLSNLRPLNLQTQVLNTFLEAYLVGGLLSFIGILILFLRNIYSLKKIYRVPVEHTIPLIAFLLSLDSLKFVFLWLFVTLLTVRNIGDNRARDI